MKFGMVRDSLLITRAQNGWKRRDQRKKYEDHCDYVYLTDIPFSGDVDEAFDYFAATVCNDDVSEVQFLLNDKTDHWTFRFRFEGVELEKEYEIDTESG